MRGSPDALWREAGPGQGGCLSRQMKKGKPRHMNMLHWPGQVQLAPPHPHGGFGHLWACCSQTYLYSCIWALHTPMFASVATSVGQVQRGDQTLSLVSHTCHAQCKLSGGARSQSRPPGAGC